jgi:hypothetical protein
MNLQLRHSRLCTAVHTHLSPPLTVVVKENYDPFFRDSTILENVIFCLKFDEREINHSKGNFLQTVSILLTYLGYAVAQLVKALCYKPEGRGFDSQECHWNFSLT